MRAVWLTAMENNCHRHSLTDLRYDRTASINADGDERPHARAGAKELLH